MNLVENGESVLKTFTDYEEELPSELVELKIEACSPLAGKRLRDAVFLEGTLVVMLKRNRDVIIPNGATELPGGRQAGAEHAGSRRAGTTGRGKPLLTVAFAGKGDIDMASRDLI